MEERIIRTRRYTHQDIDRVFVLWATRMRRSNPHEPGHYTFRDLARDTGFPLTTVHRFVKQFQRIYSDF